MDDTSGRERLSLLGARLPPSFALHVVAIDPGDERPYDPEEWRDALVVLERGELELECVYGGRRRFAEGTVLAFAGLQLRFMRNPGPGQVLLAAVSRRQPSSRGGSPKVSKSSG